MSMALFYLSEYQKKNFMGWGYSGFLLKPAPVLCQIPELASAQHLLNHQVFGEQKLAATRAQIERWQTPLEEAVATEVYEIEEPIDGWGGGPVTPERSAALESLVLVLTLIDLLDCQDNTIITDARLVLGGMKKILANPDEINLTPKGQPIPHSALWQKILELTRKLLGKGRKLHVEALKARAGVKAFDTACNNAARGWVMAYNQVASPEISYSPFANDKASARELMASSHLLQKQWYFMPQSKPMLGDRTLYFLGDHGKEPDQFGKARADSYLSVVALRQPDPFFEKIRGQFDNQGDGSDHIYIVNAKKLTETPLRQEIHQHGLNYLYLDQEDDNYKLYDDSLVVSRLHPVLKGYKAFMALNSLVALMEELLSGKADHLLRVDITEQVLIRKNKNQWGVDPKLLSGSRYLRLNLPQIPQPVVLTLDLDLPGAALHRLAKEKPQIELIWLKETRTTGRHYVLMTTGEDLSLWSAYESNLTFLKEDALHHEVLSP